MDKELNYLPLEFHCVMAEDGELSAYKGSMLRGVLGKELKRTCCALRFSECQECMVFSACPFTRLFLVGEENPPVYCIVPDEDERTGYSAGDRFSFCVRLYGYGTDFAAYFVHSAFEAGRKGMGKGGRGRFNIEAVTACGKSVCDVESRKLDKLPVEELVPPQWSREGGTADVSLTFVTPCRYKRDNGIAHDLSFLDLSTLLLRRIRTAWKGAEAEFRLDGFDSYMEEAAKVRTLENGLSWKRWRRWSNRQQNSMDFGGLVGTVRFGDVPLPFVPFIELGEKLLVGKQTSFGLGRYVFTIQKKEDAWTKG